MIFLRKETILRNIDVFENVFLRVKWVVLVDLWNFRTGRELSLISSFCIYGNASSEKSTILARVVRVTSDGRMIFHVLSLRIAMPFSLEASSQTLQWCSVLQSMGQLKVNLGCLITMFLASIALNILCNLSIYMSDSLLWSWFISGNRKKDSMYFNQKEI